ncbi:aromatic ring-hydroxylating dioxygenase subunit alpha [Streptomyces sp. BV286]|uniref:aromatic ring-hydroxylating oxygenase subunit alpha n=1 Tax=Streptomyces sp. BV286 TaxID=2849672 RepID=UPI001C2E4BE6|nr:aromatic ring-hydroxylating dioxygenase subunit alpha [Streptomyces sp. BV286]MBV1935598.1 aromatic ring-hydroxylating dioxygenase subunit alpha [Streptomyces sp. BV286]
MNFSSANPASAPDIAEMVARRAVGYSLEAPFYTSQEVYDLDLEVIFGRHWLFACAEAELAEPGDYVTLDIGRQSIIIVRDDDESIRALRNVCRHRGSRILEDPCGSVGNLVCPYHQWTYRTDGSLIHAEGQDPALDRKQFGLKPVSVRTVAGLVLVCLSDDPPTDIDEVAAVIEPYLSPYRLKDAKVAHHIDLIEEGNWKLVMENNRECQHCDAGHPELLTAYFPLGLYAGGDYPPRMRAVLERYQAAEARLHYACAATGMPVGTHRELDDRPTGYQITHLPLDGVGASFGEAGAQVSRRLIGEIAIPEFGDMSLHLQPNSWFHMLSDHAVVFRVMPVAPGKTLVRTTWLVHADAVEGVDYDVDSLTAVWSATNDQDRAFVEKCQRGASDPGYEPGPYAGIEGDVEAFDNWYINRLREHLGLNDAHLSLITHASGQ